ncbi:MAG TPA: enoyl-CoA hydratase [Caulobacteraceae bacterium]|nr:enoyl-CoA hydratase [Caulobacteraceae bacterium]
MSASDTVHTQRRGQVVLVTLNRPSARNAINFELCTAFCAAIAASQDARCIVVTGTDPAFCAGLDLKNLGVDRLAELPSYAAALDGSKVPLIAAVNGAAVTGGFEIALGCDFIVASERAVFADTHVRVGVYPGPVLVDLPRRVGMAWAREMSMTGNFVDAATALRIGLANHVKPHDELVPFALELASQIADADPRMITAMRADWNANVGPPVAEARRIHAEHARGGDFVHSRGADIAGRRETVLARSRDQRGA